MAGGNQYASVTDVGQDRELNEDNHGQYELGDGELLLVVCDGMGGHEGGEVASQIAVEAIGQIFQNSPSDDPREKLANGFRVANQRILTEAERSGAEGMGTTAVAVHVAGNRFVTAHVGDSRVYQIRDGQVVWRTTDHTRVQKMVDKGILSEEEAKVHPDANVVTRALGYRETADGEPIEAEVSGQPLVMRDGDTLVLCSDGLYDGVSDDEIAESVVGVSVQQAAQRLVDFANERGGHDNITVTVVRHGSAPARVAGAAAPAARGAQRTTDLDEGASSARNTELDESTATTTNKRPASTATEPPTDDDGRRRVAGILMILAALAIAALVLFLLLGGGGGGDDDDDDGPTSPTTTSPAANPGTGAAPTTPATSPGGAAAPTTHGAGDAPPLPENPITGGGGKKPRSGGDAPTLQPPDDPNQPLPGGSGATPPGAKAPTKQPGAKQPANSQPGGGGLFQRGKVVTPKQPADPDVKELE